MTYREQILKAKEKEMADYLKNQDAVAEKQRQDYLASQKPMAIDAMGLSLNPSERMALSERLGVENKKLSTERESGLSLMAMKQKQQNFNKLFNYAFDKYINAGYEVEQAQNFSTVWANQMQSQEWSAEDAQKSREFTQAKSDISGKYGDLIVNTKADEGDPYTQAAMRALFGLGGTYASGYLLTRNKNKTPNQTSSSSSSSSSSPSYTPSTTQELNMFGNQA